MGRFNKQGAKDERGEFVHDFDAAERMGLTVCSLDAGCIQRWPALDLYDRDVVAFFLAVQHCWRASDFSGQRKALIRSELEIEARLRGYELSEHFLDRIRICESVLTSIDSKRIAAEMNKPK